MIMIEYFLVIKMSFLIYFFNDLRTRSNHFCAIVIKLLIIFQMTHTSTNMPIQVPKKLEFLRTSVMAKNKVQGTPSTIFSVCILFVDDGTAASC